MAMMAAAPAVEAAAGSAATGAAASRSAAGAASKGAKAGAAGKAATPSGTAAGRASELAKSGTSRGKARRVLMDEFGGTGPETDRLIDDAYADPSGVDQPGSTPAGDASSASKSRPSLPSVSMPKSVSSLANAGGGALLGAFTYVLALAYLRNGKAGVKAWLKAKFLNEVTDPSVSARAAGMAQAAAKRAAS